MNAARSFTGMMRRPLRAITACEAAPVCAWTSTAWWTLDWPSRQARQFAKHYCGLPTPVNGAGILLKVRAARIYFHNSGI